MLTLVNVRFADLRRGAAIGPRELRKDAASAIAECAQVRFVRKAGFGCSQETNTPDRKRQITALSPKSPMLRLA